VYVIQVSPFIFVIHTNSKISLTQSFSPFFLDAPVEFRAQAMTHKSKLYPSTTYVSIAISSDPIESLVHEGERTLVRAEYGYPKGSQSINS
jgi:hypothetical protein